MSIIWGGQSFASSKVLDSRHQSLPFFVLIFAFIVDFDAIKLVRTHGSQICLCITVSGWAGRAGPLLLWVAWLALCDFGGVGDRVMLR